METAVIGAAETTVIGSRDKVNWSSADSSGWGSAGSGINSENRPGKHAAGKEVEQHRSTLRLPPGVRPVMRPGSKLHRWISNHLGEMEISVAEQLTIEDIMRQIEVDLHLDLRWQREWLINQVYQLTEIACLGLAPARLAEFAAADCASAAAESALQRAEQAMLCSKREQVEMEQRKQQHRVTDKRQQQLLSIGLMLQQQRRTCRAAAGAAMAALAAWGAEVAAILAGDTARLAVWMLLCR